MHSEGKLKLRSYNTSYCLIEVVTKAGLTVYYILNQVSYKLKPHLLKSKGTTKFLKRFWSCQTFGLTRGQVLSVRIIFAIFINW